MFSGTVTLEDNRSTTSRVQKVTKSGRLQTATYQGTLSSNATTQQTPLGTLFRLVETRNGMETLPEGTTFSGLQTLDVTEDPGSSGTGVPIATTTLKKDGQLTGHIFAGKLNVDVTRSMQNLAVLGSTHTITRNGTWTITPSQKLNGNLKIVIKNGTKTVTDSRTPTAI
jgi:hypothetical protein